MYCSNFFRNQLWEHLISYNSFRNMNMHLLEVAMGGLKNFRTGGGVINLVGLLLLRGSVPHYMPWLANNLSECIYHSPFSTRFFIWVIFIRVIIQIKIRKKIWFKRVPLHQCSLSKHFPGLNHLAETWLIFLTSLLLKFMNSLRSFFRFALLRKW